MCSVLLNSNLFSHAANEGRSVESGAKVSSLCPSSNGCLEFTQEQGETGQVQGKSNPSRDIKYRHAPPAWQLPKQQVWEPWRVLEGSIAICPLQFYTPPWVPGLMAVGC